MVIDTGTRICGLRITEDEVIIVGDGKVVTWGLPARNCAFNKKKDAYNSVQTTQFEPSAPIEQLPASISLNLKYVAFGDTQNFPERLYIYSRHSGKKLAATVSDGGLPGFIPSGCKVWCSTVDGGVNQWEIIEENESDAVRLEQQGKYIEPQSGFPWHSSYEYQVTDNGWILCSNGKGLVATPPLPTRYKGIKEVEWKAPYSLEFELI